MADVFIRGLVHGFSGLTVLHGIDLEIEHGSFTVLVGPSGCGKSTLLRAIAGLEEPSAGTIAIGGRNMTGVAPADRGIAMVFQSYALYPQMTLAENMGFALKLAGKPKAEIDAAVAGAARTLGIDHLLDRKPKALSGGQRQRVAIGRAIVRQPDVFLFDEPLSNLDAALRVRMRYEFASLHRQLGTTMIYVTHDQVEAMTLADRIVVLNAGRIEQAGAPLDLYEHPANLFVAGFIGSPKMNFLAGTLERSGEDVVVRLPDGTTLAAAVDAGARATGQPVTLGVRPEHMMTVGTGNRIRATVRFVENLGGLAFAYLDREGLAEPLTWQVTGRAPAIGDTVEIALPTHQLHVFDAEGSALPRRTTSEHREAA